MFSIFLFIYTPWLSLGCSFFIKPENNILTAAVHKHQQAFQPICTMIGAEEPPVMGKEGFINHGVSGWGFCSLRWPVLFSKNGERCDEENRGVNGDVREYLENIWRSEEEGCWKQVWGGGKGAAREEEGLQRKERVFWEEWKEQKTGIAWEKDH